MWPSGVDCFFLGELNGKNRPDFLALGSFLFFPFFKGASDDWVFIYSRAVVLNLRGVDFALKNHLVMSGEINFACHICGVGQWLLEGRDQGCS